MFTPSLKKGEKVKYAFKDVLPNCHPYTYEEVIERIKKGTYEYEELICEACEWFINYPTSELKFVFEFPENYEIENYYPDVRKGEAQLKAEDELKRIKEGSMFADEKIIEEANLIS